MSLRSTLWITALVVGSLTAASAQSTTPSHTFTQTFQFPPISLASTENVQINVLNAAADTHAAKASCSGNIMFANAGGSEIGTGTGFTALGSGKIATGTLPGASASSGGPSGSGPAVIAGSVSLTVDLSSFAPCTLVLSLQIMDANTGVTHAIVTTAVQTTSGPIPLFSPFGSH